MLLYLYLLFIVLLSNPKFLGLNTVPLLVLNILIPVSNLIKSSLVLFTVTTGYLGSAMTFPFSVTSKPASFILKLRSSLPLTLTITKSFE